MNRDRISLDSGVWYRVPNMRDEREEMRAWLKRNCPLKIEYDFWYYFYDDLDDCFDDIEPWDYFLEWREWDREFTGRRIRR